MPGSLHLGREISLTFPSAWTLSHSDFRITYSSCVPGCQVKGHLDGKNFLLLKVAPSSPWNIVLVDYIHGPSHYWKLRCLFAYFITISFVFLRYCLSPREQKPHLPCFLSPGPRTMPYIISAPYRFAE